uniref:Uncharacterized protein n=1 Tax=Anopheles coluzzii TaxID=1518534 RepID=A0A8W7PFE0_ANOCL
MCTSLKILSGTLAQGSNGSAHTSTSAAHTCPAAGRSNPHWSRVPSVTSSNKPAATNSGPSRRQPPPPQQQDVPRTSASEYAMPEESEISRRKVINSVLPTERDRDYDPPSGDANGKRDASWESVEKDGAGEARRPLAGSGLQAGYRIPSAWLYQHRTIEH